MKLSLFALIAVSVALSSLAQIVLKAGMSTPAVLEGLEAAPWWRAAQTIGTTPLVLGGLALYFLSALLWLLVLARIEVSLAYPFVAMGFILTMLLGWWVHGDQLSVARVAGTLLIAVGVAVVARS